MSGLHFVVHGVAQSKGSMRAFKPKGMKFPIVTDSNRNAKSWAQLVAHAASDALTARPDARVLDGPVRLTVAFHLPRPKRYLLRKWRTRQPAHLCAPDLDKLLRSVGDALKGVLYRDDAQVVEVYGLKRYAPCDAAPSVDVWVVALSERQELPYDA